MNCNIFWGFQKNKYFWGDMRILWIFFFFFFFFFGGGGSSQNWTILGVISMHLCILGSFLKVKVQNGGIFRGC